MIIFRRVRYAIACHMERYFEQNDVIMYENCSKCKDYVCNIQEECEKCNLVGLMIDADTFQIPFVQTVYSFVYFYFMMPSQVMQFGHIRQFTQCAIRFRGIPSQLTFESYFGYNLFSHFLYAEFLSCAHIDGGSCVFLYCPEHMCL